MRRSKSNSYRARPPSNFRPAQEVVDANYSLRAPSFIKTPKGMKGSRANGLRYERRGQEWFTRLRPLTYAASPWFTFRNRAGSGTSQWLWCQPDGLDIDIRAGLITIVEFKLQHTAKAWWQTRKLYEPVLREVFNPYFWQFSIVEIVKWFDPDVEFPEHFTFIADLADAKPNSFHVHIWNGKADGL